MNESSTVDNATQLKALFGGFLQMSEAVSSLLKETQPDVYALLVDVIRDGGGAIEGRILVDPEPMLVVSLRTKPEGVELVLARLQIPGPTAYFH